MDDSRSRALLTTALHPSSTPNERLMALAAFNRSLERAGIHPSEIVIAARPAPRADRTPDARAAKENAALAGRVKAQEAALRKAAREAAAQADLIATLRADLADAQAAADADACQVAALEADIAARDRIIASLRSTMRQA